MDKVMRVAADATLTSKGQLTLPARIREAMGLKSGDKLHFEPAEGGKFVVTPVHRADLMSLAGIFADAELRVGQMEFPQARKKAWAKRGQELRGRP